MTKNPHIGNDALAFLDSIIPDTPESRLAERQEIFRIALTQAMLSQKSDCSPINIKT